MTEATPSAREVESIEELVGLVHLVEIRPFEFRATASAPPAEEFSQPDINIEYSEMHTAETLIDRFRFIATTADAEYIADIAAVYEIEEPVEVPTPIRIDFAERIGFMSVFPFLRESLITSAARLSRRAPLLDLMRPGDLKIGMNGEPPQASEGE